MSKVPIQSKMEASPRARDQTEVSEGAYCSMGTVNTLNDTNDKEEISRRMHKLMLTTCGQYIVARLLLLLLRWMSIFKEK